MIQRSYSLPSCTLLVDGIITGSDVMSILTSFSCRFSHHTEPIVGGLELLNALVKVVGAYAQALKSNTLVAIPEKQVRLEPEGKHLHLLSVLLNEADAHNPIVEEGGEANVDTVRAAAHKIIAESQEAAEVVYFIEGLAVKEVSTTTTDK